MEAKGKAQKKVEEICRFILDGENNLCGLLVKAYREGLPAEKGVEAFTAVKQCCDDAIATYHAAIAQPIPKISVKQRVVL